MDFRLGEKSEKVRLEAWAFLAEALTPEVRRTMEETGVHHSWDFHRKLVERGWMAPAGPRSSAARGGTPSKSWPSPRSCSAPKRRPTA